MINVGCRLSVNKLLLSATLFDKKITREEM